MALSQNTPASSELHRDVDPSTTDQVSPETVRAAAQYRENVAQRINRGIERFLERASFAELRFMEEVLQNWEGNVLDDQLFTLLSAFEYATDDRGWHDFVKVPKCHTDAVSNFLRELEAPPTAFKPQENGWRLWKGERTREVTN